MRIYLTISLALLTQIQVANAQWPPPATGAGLGAFIAQHPNLAIIGGGLIGREIAKHPFASAAAMATLVIGGVEIYRSSKAYREEVPNGICRTVSGNQFPTGTFAFVRKDEVPGSDPHWPHQGDHYHWVRATIDQNGKCHWMGGFSTDSLIPGALPSAEPFI